MTEIARDGSDVADCYGANLPGSLGNDGMMIFNLSRRFYGS
jgi:hypothetical protein